MLRHQNHKVPNWMRHTRARKSGGSCVVCGVQIQQGDHIVPHRKSGWGHIKCAMKAREAWYARHGKPSGSDKTMVADPRREQEQGERGWVGVSDVLEILGGTVISSYKICSPSQTKTVPTESGQLSLLSDDGSGLKSDKAPGAGSSRARSTKQAMASSNS